MIALSTTRNVVNANVMCNLAAIAEPNCPRTPGLTTSRPKLQRRNANRSKALVNKRRKHRKSRQSLTNCSSTAPSVSLCVSVSVPMQFDYKKRPYIVFAKRAGNGFLRSSECETQIHMPAGIKTLCLDFYYDEATGVEQIGFMLYRLLKKTKQTSIVRATASQLIQKYLSLAGAADAGRYFDLLVQQKCLTLNAPSSSSKYLNDLRDPSDATCASAYHISDEKKFEFSRIRKR